MHTFQSKSIVMFYVTQYFRGAGTCATKTAFYVFSKGSPRRAEWRSHGAYRLVYFFLCGQLPDKNKDDADCAVCRISKILPTVVISSSDYVTQDDLALSRGCAS